MMSVNIGTLVLALLALFISRWIWRYLRDPLGDVPGPFWSRFTRLWELSAVRSPGFTNLHFDLHKKYGPIVRLAPNRYSINTPKDVEQIYSHGSKFVKAPFYHAFGNPDANFADTFSERSVARHALKRRKVASLYSMSTLLSYEQFVDRCNKALADKLGEIATSLNTFFDVSKMMQYYAFDVIGEISVGQSFGFIEAGNDFNGILQAIHDSMTYGSRVGLFAELHPIAAWVARITNQPIPFDKVIAFINKNIKVREVGKLPTDRNDFLSKLLELEKAGKIERHDVITSLGANIAAGSDTTGLTLSAVVYYLAKNPEKTKKLRAEIQEFERAGTISDPVTFTESQRMPYLQAVIKEALRIHPATGQPLSRVVPPEGAKINGRFFPGGVEVGTSPWLTHFDKAIFGEDAEQFVPERWLESAERSTRMDRQILSFGAGARTCLGKNISMLEMTKVIPQLYRRFDFVLERPNEDWNLNMVWFVKQQFECRVELL